jgi:chemotaxis protein MotB
MLKARGFAAAAMLTLGAGCVPLSDYNKMKERYDYQESFVKKHKDELKELERNANLLGLRMGENAKDMERMRLRLEASERLRHQLEQERGKNMVTTVVETAAPKHVSADFGGFHVNGNTGGIVLEHDLMFSKGHSEIKASGKKLLAELVTKLNGAEYGKFFIRVDGHTDSAPVIKSIKENHDNWELGAKRAKAVLDYLIKEGIAPERCFFASFGPYSPIVAAAKGKHATDSEAQNRRVEIVLFEKKL